MTCKTHTILAALRKFREDGFTGKINPAMIRDLTGIDKPGTSLCDLRRKGYLLDAGEIKLAAARGTTTANQYMINPESDLMPRNKYDVSQHQKKMRGGSQPTKIGEIRKIIQSFNGRVFSTTEVRKAAGMYAHTNQRLTDLAELEEIVKLEKKLTGGRSSMTWQEIHINESLISEAPVVTADAKQSSNPWASVWPEFFSLPKLQGTVRIYCEVL
jgi:hypothetical protein